MPSRSIRTAVRFLNEEDLGAVSAAVPLGSPLGTLSSVSSLQLVSDCFANVQSSCCNSLERLDSTSKSATNSVLFVSEEQSSNLLRLPTCSANASGILCNSIDPFLGSIIFESARLGCACNSVWNSLVCSRVDVRLRACAQ